MREITVSDLSEISTDIEFDFGGVLHFDKQASYLECVKMRDVFTLYPDYKQKFITEFCKENGKNVQLKKSDESIYEKIFSTIDTHYFGCYFEELKDDGKIQDKSPKQPFMVILKVIAKDCGCSITQLLSTHTFKQVMAEIQAWEFIAIENSEDKSKNDLWRKENIDPNFKDKMEKISNNRPKLSREEMIRRGRGSK